MIAAGFALIIFGYATAYSGGSYFFGTKVKLMDALGVTAKSKTTQTSDTSFVQSVSADANLTGQPASNPAPAIQGVQSV